MELRFCLGLLDLMVVDRLLLLLLPGFWGSSSDVRCRRAGCSRGAVPDTKVLSALCFGLAPIGTVSVRVLITTLQIWSVLQQSRSLNRQHLMQCTGEVTQSAPGRGQRSRGHLHFGDPAQLSRTGVICTADTEYDVCAQTNAPLKLLLLSVV